MELVEALQQRCPGSPPPTNEALMGLSAGDSVYIGNSTARFWVLLQSVVHASNPQDSRFTAIRERELEIGLRRVIQFQGKHIYEIAQ